jgi:uncharacterized protein (TIGR02271 family)
MLLPELHAPTHFDVTLVHESHVVSHPQRDDVTLKLIEERLSVSRRVVQGQTVRITTATRLHGQLVEEPLTRETIEIERVAVGRMVGATPEVRQEGDVTILPVMEEVLVLERRLVLKEEVRIRRVRTTEMHRETVHLRKQDATVTRLEPLPPVINRLNEPSRRKTNPMRFGPRVRRARDHGHGHPGAAQSDRYR